MQLEFICVGGGGAVVVVVGGGGAVVVVVGDIGDVLVPVCDGVVGALEVGVEGVVVDCTPHPERMAARMTMATAAIRERPIRAPARGGCGELLTSASLSSRRPAVIRRMATLHPPPGAYIRIDVRRRAYYG